MAGRERRMFAIGAPRPFATEVSSCWYETKGEREAKKEEGKKKGARGKICLLHLLASRTIYKAYKTMS